MPLGKVKGQGRTHRLLLQVLFALVLKRVILPEVELLYCRCSIGFKKANVKNNIVISSD
jgi:hypothetical protein